ncbi:hypothetical protein DVB73_01315 [Pseudomonas plecoglossicida]|uniref:DUF2790 domain-containing protein n=2 Tax=Pseudomonas plecoglossicida TaxID=70775 RepID=A0AAD0QY48_PSEDL|nr:hypothetical protein DVB73_01315 [Pseudomonas plecoglossicida]
MVLAATLIAAGLVQAAEHAPPGSEAQQTGAMHRLKVDASTAQDADAPVKLPQHKRGIGPVVGMPCEVGYRLVGDDCVMSNVEFE